MEKYVRFRECRNNSWSFKNPVNFHYYKSIRIQGTPPPPSEMLQNFRKHENAGYNSRGACFSQKILWPGAGRRKNLKISNGKNGTCDLPMLPGAKFFNHPELVQFLKVFQNSDSFSR